MFSLLAALVLAPQSGILVIDKVGVGMTVNGKWQSMESLTMQDWPKRKISDAAVEKIAKGPIFFLGANEGVTKAAGVQQDLASGKGSFKFVGDEGDPGGRGWILDAPSMGDDHKVNWFGPQPKVPKVTLASKTSAVYLGVVQNFLKSKGIKSAKPVLDTVVLADLDANGTQEALIFASSRPYDQMSDTLSMERDKPSNDFSLVIIRYISGRTVKVATVYYADKRKGMMDGYCRFDGLYDLDGKPGLEILKTWSGYEAWGSDVSDFSKGKVIKLAENGDGV